MAHKKFFSHCEFLRGEQTYNIPYADYNEIAREINRATLLGEIDIEEPALPLTTDDPKIGVDTTLAMAPEYSTQSARSQTFRYGFERASPVPAQSLNEAGFYSLGEGDKVKCFWCDGALEQWTKGDDPWQEHAK